MSRCKECSPSESGFRRTIFGGNDGCTMNKLKSLDISGGFHVSSARTDVRQLSRCCLYSVVRRLSGCVYLLVPRRSFCERSDRKHRSAQHGIVPRRMAYGAKVFYPGVFVSFRDRGSGDHPYPAQVVRKAALAADSAYRRDSAALYCRLPAAKCRTARKLACFVRLCASGPDLP